MKPDEEQAGYLDVLSRAIGSLTSAEKGLRAAGLPECADSVRAATDAARTHFMILWEAMLRAKGRWPEDESAQRLQMAMAHVYLGET